jgi:hypothetical protein
MNYQQPMIAPYGFYTIGPVTFNFTSFLTIPSGTTDERADGIDDTIALLRFNTEIDGLEVKNSTGWTPLLTDNNNTNNDDALIMALVLGS